MLVNLTHEQTLACPLCLSKNALSSSHPAASKHPHSHLSHTHSFSWSISWHGTFSTDILTTSKRPCRFIHVLHRVLASQPPSAGFVPCFSGLFMNFTTLAGSYRWSAWPWACWWGMVGDPSLARGAFAQRYVSFTSPFNMPSHHA